MLNRPLYNALDVSSRRHSPVRRWLGSVACFAAMTVTVGCGGETGPTTVPVAGTVTMSGEPIAGAQITFLNDEFAAYAETDAEGRFDLRPGAVVGENKVIISKWEGDMPMSEDDGMDAGQMDAMAMVGGADAPKQLVPPEYTDANTTPLQFTVPEGGTDGATFDL